MAQLHPYTRVGNSLVITLPESAGCRWLKLEVISDKIIHVLASPAADPKVVSLMAIAQKPAAVNWSVKEIGGVLTLRTASIIVKTSLKTGSVSFEDLNGKIILQNGARSFVPVSFNGEASYAIKQAFKISANDAIYGLGQHQEGVLNYRGKQVSLLQNNTEVAIPFLLSSANYGILWDNYSITKVGDVRDYQPLSSLKLISANGEPGWLTATYSSKANPGEVQVRRPESTINYLYLSDMGKFPPAYKLSGGMVTWEGAFQSPYTGVHHFLSRYAGYIKIWLDGKLVADKWRQSWNPGSELIPANLIAGNTYKLKIEWKPEGGESYIAFNWLAPVPDADKNMLSFASEAGDAINYYFISGKNADEVVSGYRSVTGKATMMPKWAMGLWQSRERYKTEEEILNTIKTFREKKIPIDNIVLDWSYWKENQWGSQEFDETRFPDPAGMVKKLHDLNTHFMISVWAKFYEGIDAYNEFDKNGWLYKRNIADRRRDWIGKGYVSTFYDAYNPQARIGFWNLLNKHLYSKGIDAWWMDASEPDIHSNLNIENRKETMEPTFLGSSTKYFNAFALENAKGIYEGQRATNPDSRVFILTRSAYAGQQRYAAATWSGDIASRWEDFKAQIPAGINFSLSGTPYWTTDIGGFAVEPRYEKATGSDLDEWRELQTRWYQFGAFSPLFRVHGQLPNREIFNIAPDNHPAYKSMLYYDKLRYRLMPYIYSLVGKTYHNDYTIMRGLVMDFGTDKAVANIADQYMFGPAMLINPVYQYGAKNREVYLPKATGWYDLYTGKWYAGGQTITASATYERMPVFVKEGSIIPAGPEIQYTSQKPDGPVTLYVYTGSNGAFSLYEDEGTNYNYEKGSFSNIPFSYNEKLHTLSIGARQGSFTGMPASRTFKIIVVGRAMPAAFDIEDRQVFKELIYSGKPIQLKLNIN